MNAPSYPTVPETDELHHEAFCELFAHVLEGSPWVVDLVARLRPHTSLEGMYACFDFVLRDANLRDQLQALQAHPRLATGVAASEASVEEQTGAGLRSLTPEEKARFDELNAEYEARFGFPFIIAVTGLDKHTILARFEERVTQDLPPELDEALAQLIRIVLIRVSKVMGDI